MTDLAYKVEKLKELIEAKKGAEVHQEPIQKTSDPEPSSMLIAKKNLLNPAPMPDSLKGLSALEIELLFLDDRATDAERNWYRTRKNKPLNEFPPGPLSWMGF